MTKKKELTFEEVMEKERAAFARGNRDSEYGSSTLYEVDVAFVFGRELKDEIKAIEKKLDLDIIHTGKREYEVLEKKSRFATSYEDDDEEEYISETRVDYVVSYSHLSRPRVLQVIDAFTYRVDFRLIEVKIEKND